MRYKTAAERAFQGEYRMVEQHIKDHPLPESEETEPETPRPRVRPSLFSSTTKPAKNVDTDGNHYPPHPDYVSQPIIPGQYPANHPSNWHPPKEEKRKNRR